MVIRMRCVQCLQSDVRSTGTREHVPGVCYTMRVDTMGVRVMFAVLREVYLHVLL